MLLPSVDPVQGDRPVEPGRGSAGFGEMCPWCRSLRQRQRYAADSRFGQLQECGSRPPGDHLLPTRS
jgi:hypothetical protein